MDIAWLGGLLEGEGSFMARRYPTKRWVSISIKMCDEDVVQRAASLMQAEVFAHPPRNPNHSAVYVTQQTRSDLVLALGSRLARYLGERRSESLRQSMAIATEILGDRLYQRGLIDQACRQSVDGDTPPFQGGIAGSSPVGGSGESVARYWLAGLLEGEGSFLSVETPGRKYPKGVIALQMCDEDVVTAAHDLLGGRGQVRAYPSRVPHGRTVYAVKAAGRRRVVELCESLLPLMGSRRTVALERCLQAARSGL